MKEGQHFSANKPRFNFQFSQSYIWDDGKMPSSSSLCGQPDLCSLWRSSVSTLSSMHSRCCWPLPGIPWTGHVWSGSPANCWWDIRKPHSTDSSSYENICNKQCIPLLKSIPGKQGVQVHNLLKFIEDR